MDNRTASRRRRQEQGNGTWVGSEENEGLDDESSPRGCPANGGRGAMSAAASSVVRNARHASETERAAPTEGRAPRRVTVQLCSEKRIGLGHIHRRLQRDDAEDDRQLAPPPVAQLIGFQVTRAEGGSAEFQLNVETRHHNPMGTLHGGIIVDVADAAMGCALASTLQAGETYTTIELHSNGLQPVRQGRITARAKVVKKTRSLGLVECDVTDDGGSLVARLSSTCMLLRGEKAEGR